MANIKRIEGKTGLAFKITVTTGRGTDGKQVRHYMTWKPTAGMTERQIEKAVQKVAFMFEQQIEKGFIADNRQTFAQYAEYVIDLKERSGTKRRTVLFSTPLRAAFMRILPRPERLASSRSRWKPYNFSRSIGHTITACD